MRFFENVFFTLVDLFNSVDDCKQPKGPTDMLQKQMDFQGSETRTSCILANDLKIPGNLRDLAASLI